MSKLIDRTGETRIMNCGQKATIINYYNSNRIDIQFEDKTIISNKRYDAFNKGAISHPNIKNKKTRIDRTGETNIANNGMKMTIITYRNNNNIDIQFEDGAFVYNKQYQKFKIGNIGYPDTINRIGETRMMKCGLKATIIKYNNNKDINIKFEDNTTICNKTYLSFKKGIIRHPTIKTKKTDHTGETRMMKCGLKATITQYDNAHNINIQFEDSTAIYNKRYAEFKKGEIGHPNIINNIKLKEFAYKLNDDWYYIRSHQTWTEDKILSVKEIYAYQLKQVA